MSEKIEIMGISVEKCYAEDVMESINQQWYQETLATYGVLTMNLLLAAQQDEELKEYIETLDKAVADEPEIVKAAGLEDKEWENDISEHGFFGTVFWLLNHYKNEIFLLGENEEDTEKLYGYLQEKYPDIVILGKDFLMGDEDDQVDKVINEINMWNPQAVLSCSRVYDLERFVKRHRKKSIQSSGSVWEAALIFSVREAKNQAGSTALWKRTISKKWYQSTMRTWRKCE